MLFWTKWIKCFIVEKINNVWSCWLFV